MKQSRIIAGILLLGLSAFCLEAQENQPEPITLVEVSENVYQLNGGRGSNGGVIVGENAVMVIDAKMDKLSVDQTLEAIKELTDKPVKYLVNTHSDGDHIYGNRYFPSTVTFIAHENCRDDFFKVNFGRESDWDEAENYPFVPALTFSESMDIWMGKSKVELHYYGIGHTTGDAVVYYPAGKVAFVADMYFQGRPQLIHSGKGGNSFAYVKTIKKMLENLDAEIFLSGHADPIGRSEYEKHLQSMMDRQEKVKSLMKDGKNQDEVLAAFGEDETRLVTSIYQELAQMNK